MDRVSLARLFRGFRRPPSQDLFSSEWGFSSTFAFPVSQNWQEVDYEDVANHILQLAGNPDLAKLENASVNAADLFRKSQEEIVTILSILLDQLRTDTIEELRDAAKEDQAFRCSEDHRRASTYSRHDP